MVVPPAVRPPRSRQAVRAGIAVARRAAVVGSACVAGWASLAPAAGPATKPAGSPTSRPTTETSAIAPIDPTTAPVEAVPAGSAEGTPADPAAEAAVRRALSGVVDLELKNADVPTVLAALSKGAGVPIEAAEGTYALLPWGRQTTLPVVDLKDRTLAQGLSAVTQKLGLEFAPSGGCILVRPSPALARLGRAATTDELATLDLLSGRPLGGEANRTTVRRLVDAVDVALADADRDAEAAGRPAPKVDIELQSPDPSAPARPVSVGRNETLAGALDAVDRQTKLTWRAEGKRVVVVPKSDQVARRLARTVDAKYDAAEVNQVLADLSRVSGVPFQIEPGAVQRIPPEFRTVTLGLENATVAQALESLGGVTGLGYLITDGGSVYLWNQSSTPGQSVRDRPIGIVKLPDGMDLFVYDSDVPEDLRGYYDARKQEAFDAQRKQPTAAADRHDAGHAEQ